MLHEQVVDAAFDAQTPSLTKCIVRRTSAEIRDFRKLASRGIHHSGILTRSSLLIIYQEFFFLINSKLKTGHS